MQMKSDDVLVALRNGGRLRWFVSDKGLWVLDWGKWAAAFESMGYEDHDPEHEGRFRIEVLDQDSFGEFLIHMAGFECDPASLAGLRTVDDEPAYPELFVDVDRRLMVVGYVESPDYSLYPAAGWSVVDGDPGESVPPEARFWTA